MRITALCAYFLNLLGVIELLLIGLFDVSASSIILGYGSFLQRLFYCLVGVSGVFSLGFVFSYKPFKSLCK